MFFDGIIHDEEKTRRVLAYMKFLVVGDEGNLLESEVPDIEPWNYDCAQIAEDVINGLLNSSRNMIIYEEFFLQLNHKKIDSFFRFKGAYFFVMKVFEM